MAAGVCEGDEVIVPSHTFVASAAAIHHCGAVPVLVDCGRDHLIDHDSLVAAITEKTKAIMPVQLNGRVSNMDPILATAKKHGLLILEDSCQALGAKFDGRFGGTFGVAGTFSFFPAKTLGCFGDGGGIITNDSDIFEAVKMIRDHGRSPADGKAKLFGFNGRLDNLHAAVLGLKLKYYDEDISRRRAIASIYEECLGKIEELLLPPAPNSDARHFDVFQNYEIEATNRDSLREFLETKGIGTILQWGGFALHQFKDLGFDQDLPFTEAMTKKFMLLPMHPMLKDEDVLYICDAIKEFYEHND
jgi:dTDP-4-amino-4,6-dideoxygalactose transaminase